MAEGDYKVKAIVSADTSQFNDGMKKAQSSLSNISKSIQGVQNLLKSAFSVVGITASVGAVVNFGKKAVSAADEANKRFNVLANTIKATGANTWTSVEELDKMAKAYAQSTNYSVSEVEKMQSVLLGFRNITGETFEQASDAIMDMATVMGMDLTSAVQTVGKALDDPVKGLDSLRRQGFQFTEEQKAELQQLIKNGDQLKAQQIILDELATTYGGAAKAGQSAFAKLQHSMDEFKENIGNKLMPVIETIMGKLTENMNRITSIINSEEFDRFVAILVNVANKVKSVLERTLNEIKTLFDNIKSNINSIDFSPLISILDTLIGIVKKTFDEIKTNIQKVFTVFDELKQKMSGFTEILNLEKITTIINTIIDVFYFLRDEIKSIGDEIRKLIFDNIVKIWDYLKQVFNNSNSALQNSESSIQSWGQFFYETFDNVFRIFQDLFGGIKAILTGDWEVAWEYAKLAMMRVADNILNLMSTIANAFPNLINGMIDALNKLVVEINKVRDFFGQDPLGLVKSISSVDLSESSGLNAKIAQAEKKIEELTGKSADISIKQLQGISKVAAGTTQAIINDITDTTDVVLNNANKRNKIETSEYEGMEAVAESAYQKTTEWDIKLLQQQLGTLKEYSNEYHDVSLQVIEAERQKAHEADTTGTETEKINKYYNRQIELENKRHTKAVIEQVSNVAKKVADIMKGISNVVIGTIKSLFGGIRNIIGKFGNLFNFNINDTLDDLLEFEDAVLTFFVETLPQLPGFFESALQSILVLLTNISEYINSDQIKGVISGIINAFTKYLPDIMDMGMSILETLMDGFMNAIDENKDKFIDLAEKIIDNLGKLFDKIIVPLTTKLGEFVDKVIEKLLPLAVEAFIKSLPAFLIAIIKGLVNSLKTIIDILVQALPDLIKAVLEVLTYLIEDVIPKLLPELIDAIAKIIDLLVQSLPKIIELVLTLASKIIENLPQILDTLLPHIISALIEVVPQIVMAVLNGITTLISNLTTKDIWELIASIGSMLLQIAVSLITFLPQFVSELLGGLEKTLRGANWEDIKDVFEKTFSGIGDNFKKTWDDAIKSVKTSFENMAKSIKDTLQAIWNFIQAIIGGIKEMGQKAKDVLTDNKLVEGAKAIGEAVGGAAKTAGGWIADKATSAWEGLTGLFKHANGTNNAPMGLSLVGEAGPELVRFRGGEQVLNAHNTQKALAGMGGNTNEFNVNFYNTTDTSAYAIMREFKQYNRQMAINGII